MALPNAILFPQALLPLYIFEACYREMLNKTLENQRMFAVALCDVDLKPYPIGGIGLVRACVHNPDGTANLVLQGVARVRFTRFVQRNPYYVAEIEPLTSLPSTHPELETIASQILTVVNQAVAKGQKVPDWMMRFLDELKDYEVLADLVAYTFIEDVLTKQAILEELDLHRRLIRVRDALAAQANQADFPFD
jgi:Lon protease-like protein